MQRYAFVTVDCLRATVPGGSQWRLSGSRVDGTRLLVDIAGAGGVQKGPSWRGPSPPHLFESSETYPYPRGLAGPEIVELGGLNGPHPKSATSGRPKTMY